MPTKTLARCHARDCFEMNWGFSRLFSWFPATVVLLIIGGAFPDAQAVAASVSPDSGNGSNQVFSAAFTDSNGYADIQWVQLMLATATNGGGNTYCLAHYDVSGNGLYLFGDGGSFIGPVAPGVPSNQLQNSFCAINTAVSSRSASGDLLTLNVAVVFKTAGARNTYLRLSD